MGSFDIKELDKFSMNLLDLAETKMPKETKKFLKKEANKLKKRVVSKAKGRVKKQSGSYLKSWKSGRVYKYLNNEMAVRVYSSSRKAHLIEDGHRIVRGGKEVGFVRGKYVLKDATKDFERQYYDDINKFIDEVVDKGL